MHAVIRMQTICGCNGNADVMQHWHSARMSITVTLAPALRDWLAGNLARGTSPAAMIEALVARQFEPRVAQGLIAAFVDAQAAGLPLPQHSVELGIELPAYDYGTPRIAAGNVIDAAGHAARVPADLRCEPARAVL